MSLRSTTTSSKAGNSKSLKRKSSTNKEETTNETIKKSKAKKLEVPPPDPEQLSPEKKMQVGNTVKMYTLRTLGRADKGDKWPGSEPDSL